MANRLTSNDRIDLSNLSVDNATINNLNWPDVSGGGTGTGGSGTGPGLPTALVGSAPVIGVANTFMRSDAAPALSATGVVAGNYSSANISVDANGRITNAANGTGAAPGVPTALVGAAAIPGVATTYMRSDAAPALNTTGVAPGAYTNANITVDANGRINLASDGAQPAAPTALVGSAAIPGVSTNYMRSDAAPALDTTGVTAGAYTNADITVDANGRISTAANGTVPTAANPTAEVDGTATNGTATTFMRSDAAPKLADTAVIPGSYYKSQILVDQQGRLTNASNSQLIGYQTYHLDSDVGPGAGTAASGILGAPGFSAWTPTAPTGSCRPGPIPYAGVGITLTNGVFGFPPRPAIWRVTVVISHVVDISLSNSREVIVESDNGLGPAPEQIFNITQVRPALLGLTGTSSGTSTCSFLVNGDDACKILIPFSLAAGSADQIRGGLANTNIQFELMYLP